jgi:hypothetical protein
MPHFECGAFNASRNATRSSLATIDRPHRQFPGGRDHRVNGISVNQRMRSLDLPRDAGAVYRKRAGVVSRHHDDTMMRDENQVKKCKKYLILLNKLAGVVQW